MATPTPDQFAVQDSAFLKQAAQDKAAKAQEQAQQGQPPSFLERWTTNVGRVTSNMIDSAVSFAQDPAIADSPGMRKAKDVVTGAVTGAVNTADAVMSGAKATGLLDEPADVALAAGRHPGDLSQGSMDLWNHAKGAVLDFRDAAAVKDPTLSDNLVQGAAQLAIPFTGYSRALSGVHGFANMVAAGAVTDATALGPHDPRMADLFSLGRHTEGKLGDVLRTIAPDGSALNAYVNYLSDRGNESEAEGRFKNVLDGLGVNVAVTPLIHAAATVLKQGTAGLRYMIDNGVGSMGELGSASAKSQRGSVGVTEDAPQDSDIVKALRKQYEMLKAIPVDYRTNAQQAKMSNLLEKISDQYGHERAMQNGETGGEVKARVAENMKAITDKVALEAYHDFRSGTDLTDVLNKYPQFNRDDLISEIRSMAKSSASHVSLEDHVTGQSAPKPPALSLAVDNGPARSRVDVTENMPSQGTTAFPDRYKRPETQRIESDKGYIGFIDKGDHWQIDDAFVKPEARGQGIGQTQLMGLAQRANEAGKPLVSDTKVSADQLRVYESLKKKGQITFDGPHAHGPVFTNIRPVEK